MQATLRALAICIAMLLAARSGLACGKERPWVGVTVPDALGLASEIVEQLRAGLSARGFDVCAHEKGTGVPVASVELSASQGQVVAIEVSVKDAITAKKVSREVDLSELPRDAWALTLALAMDELLRASWAELALRDAPPPARPVPVEVRETVRESLPARAPERSAPRFAAGTALVFELFGGGQRQLGVDARFGVWPLPQLGLSALVGLRSGLGQTSNHGDVSSSVLVAGLGAVLGLTDPSAALGLDALARVEIARFEFSASADPGASSRSDSAVGVVTKGGVAGWLMAGSALRLGVEVLAGAPLRSVGATDDGETVVAASGIALSTGVSLAGVF